MGPFRESGGPILLIFFLLPGFHTYNSFKPVHMNIVNNFFVVELNTFPHFLNFKIAWHNHSSLLQGSLNFCFWWNNILLVFLWLHWQFLSSHLGWNVLIFLTSQTLDAPGLMLLTSSLSYINSLSRGSHPARWPLTPGLKFMSSAMIFPYIQTHISQLLLSFSSSLCHGHLTPNMSKIKLPVSFSKHVFSSV